MSGYSATLGKTRTEAIIKRFCNGMTPSEIDMAMRLVVGTARNVISDWWLDDKLYRTGCAENFVARK